MTGLIVKILTATALVGTTVYVAPIVFDKIGGNSNYDIRKEKLAEYRDEQLGGLTVEEKIRQSFTEAEERDNEKPGYEGIVLENGIIDMAKPEAQDEDPDPESPRSYEDVSESVSKFTGRVTKMFSFRECADPSAGKNCSVIVDNNKEVIIINYSDTRDYGIQYPYLENDMVEVYAEKVDENTYTIYGSTGYYIKGI